MSIPYELIVQEDLNLGNGEVDVSMPGGGSAKGTQIGPHTFGIVDVRDFGFKGNDANYDDRPSIQAAIDYIGGLGGGTVRFPDGGGIINIHSKTGHPTTIAVSWNNLTIDGNGWVMTDNFAPSGGAAIFGLNVTGFVSMNTMLLTGVQAIAKGDAFFTCLSAGDAANYAAGDPVYIRTAVNPLKAEVNKVLSSNSGTGVVRMVYAAAQDYASEGGSAFGVANAKGQTYENFTLKDLTFNTHIGALSLAQMINVSIERCQMVMDTPTLTNSAPFLSPGNLRRLRIIDCCLEWRQSCAFGGGIQLATGCSDTVIKGCSFSQAVNGESGCLLVSEWATNTRVVDCHFVGASNIGGAQYEDFWFTDNYVAIDTGTSAPTNNFVAVGGMKGLHVDRNLFLMNSNLQGCVFAGGTDGSVVANTIRCVNSGLLLGGDGVGLIVNDNIIETGLHGIQVITTSHGFPIVNNHIVQRGATHAGVGILVSDNGAQDSANYMKGNVARGFSVGYQLAAPAHETGYDIEDNLAIDCSTTFNPLKGIQFYAPTAANPVNVTIGTISQASYLVDDFHVLVIGKIDLTVIGSGPCSFDINIPVPTNFIADYTGTGSGSGDGNSEQLLWTLIPIVASPGRIQFRAIGPTGPGFNQSVYYTFTYPRYN